MKFLIATALLFMAFFTVLVYPFSTTIGTVQLVITLLFAAFCIYFFKGKRKNADGILDHANRYFTNRGGADGFPFPAVVVKATGEPVWQNRAFEEQVLGGEGEEDRSPEDMLKHIPLAKAAAQKKPVKVSFADRYFLVYAAVLDEEETAYLLFFSDNTELRRDAEEFNLSKPVVLQLHLDNPEEIYKNYKNSECEVINGELETILETWASKFNCLFRRLGDGKYFMVIEERALTRMVGAKFPILKQIRNYSYRDKKLNMTLSVGVGRGSTLSESDDLSKQALEISQSRGGDQVTVNTDGSLEFYGGTVSNTGGTSQVKARMMATHLAEQVRASDVVFAEGHTFSDLDSVGACAGVFELAKALGKPCYILCDTGKSMSRSLIKKLQSDAMPAAFIDRTQALSLMRGKESLLIVVDTHRPDSVEYPELTAGFSRVANIDHHRRTANIIPDLVFFYNEPSASSACEMVTELLQYIPAVVKLHPDSADALLSGIALDTRNFVLGTGVRTFNAASFLKRQGANTVAVRQMFSNDLSAYKRKADILQTAYMYENCAIAVAETESEDLRAVASQVADEMLGVTGTKSSYVLFKDGDDVNISARSLGDMNVQYLMEKFGGGGHLTMAAAQLNNTTVSEAKAELEKAISEYLTEAETE